MPRSWLFRRPNRERESSAAVCLFGWDEVDELERSLAFPCFRPTLNPFLSLVEGTRASGRSVWPFFFFFFWVVRRIRKLLTAPIQTPSSFQLRDLVSGTTLTTYPTTRHKPRPPETQRRQQQTPRGSLPGVLPVGTAPSHRQSWLSLAPGRPARHRQRAPRARCVRRSAGGTVDSMSGLGSQPPQMQPQPPPKRPHGPRLYHKKSKAGCYRCKGRRVKCDEKRPVCGGCSRHLVECVYPTATAAPAGDGVRHQRTRAASSRSSGQPQCQQQAAARPPLDAVASGPSLGSLTADGGQQRLRHRRGPSPEGDEDIAPPECRERRVTEMRLLYHYLMTQARTFRRPFSLASLPGASASPAATAASSPATAATPTTANGSTWTLASAGSGSSHTSHPFGSSSPFGHHTHHHHHPNPHPHPQPQPQPPPAGSGTATFVWSVETIEMAFESDAILYILLAQSALSSWAEAVAALPPAEAERGAGYGYENVADPDCHRWRRLQRQYAAMALREHRRAVAGLSAEELAAAQDATGAATAGFSPPATQTPPGRADHQNHHHQPPPGPPSSPADYVCMSSLMILSHAFALVQTVPTKPRWTPPLEWLQMGYGAGQVLNVARGMLLPGRDRMVRFLSTPPRFDRDDIFTEPNRAPLMWLLDRPPPLQRRRGGGRDGDDDDDEEEDDGDGDDDDDDNIRHRSPPDEGAAAVAALGPATPERVTLPHMDEDIAMAGGDGGQHQHGDMDDDTGATSAASAASDPHPHLSPSPAGSSHASDTDPADAELSDPATRAVYERVLCYIGWTERAVCSHADPGEAAGGEPLFGVCRRFAAFAVWTPEAFHEFLRARRPRALVVLAYFFALWIPFRDVWMIGTAGLDQVRAIRGALPPRWRPRLDPLAARYGIAWGVGSGATPGG
ncbi:hypothetical protein RB595_006775 [Gaeumannomyces hyphopodioides]